MAGLVLEFDSREATPPVAGAKAARLARLARLGLSVPPGFILTVAAFRRFVEGCRPPLPIGAGDRAPDPARLERIAARMRDGITSTPLPGEIADALGTALAARGRDAPLAVRSSAIEEDLPDASFAGSLSSFLNVRGEADLRRAVLECWASLWSARALAYRLRMGIPSGTPAMAVLVQDMVAAEVSGVLFTVDPVGGSPDRMIVEATWGLGEALAGGRADPDRFLVDRSTGEIRESARGDKKVMTVAAGTGTTDAPVPEEARRTPCLRAEHVAALHLLGLQVERAMGGPQDIEWALSDGRIHLLQSRPVTATGAARAIPRVPGDDAWPLAGTRPARSFDLWTQANVGEIWPHPLTPLSACGVPELLNDASRSCLPLVREMSRIQWAGRFHGRIYYNEGAISHLFADRLGLPAAALDRGFGSRASRTLGDGHRTRPGRLLLAMPHLILAALIQERSRRRLWKISPQIAARAAAFERRPLAARSDEEILDELHRWSDLCLRILRMHAAVSGAAMMSYALLERLLGGRERDRDLAHDLISGLSGIATAGIAVELESMAQLLREAGLDGIVRRREPDDALGILREHPDAGEFNSRLAEFLSRHGHRCAGEGEVMTPRWAERPGRVIEMLAGYLRGARASTALEALAAQRARREEAIQVVKRRLGPLRRPLFRALLTRVQDLVRLRENGRHDLSRTGLPVCRIYRELARRGVQRGWLDSEEDFYFLTLGEIESILDRGARRAGFDTRAIIAGRREAYDHWFRSGAPDCLGPGGAPLAGAGTDTIGGNGLTGVPASAGRVTGIARIVRDASEAARLQRGDILVTIATDTGWTPLFPLVGGLILELGGQLSHGAIVAREYGLPAVVNVTGATARIRDGHSVTIDGSTGRISW